jgi:hypothetical protein
VATFSRRDSFLTNGILWLDSLVDGTLTRRPIIAFALFAACSEALFVIAACLYLEYFTQYHWYAIAKLREFPKYALVVLIIAPCLYSDFGLIVMFSQIHFRELLRRKGWPPILLGARHLNIPETAWESLPRYEEWILTGQEANSPRESLDLALDLILAARKPKFGDA